MWMFIEMCCDFLKPVKVSLLTACVLSVWICLMCNRKNDCKVWILRCITSNSVLLSNWKFKRRRVRTRTVALLICWTSRTSPDWFLCVFWRIVGCSARLFGGPWHEIVWEALQWATMWACFSRPCALRSCVESRAKNALILARAASAKAAAPRPWRARHRRLWRAPRAQLHRATEIKIKCSSPSSSSHGRISIRYGMPGPRYCFPWEYTVFPVCCHHHPFCTEEEQGSQDLSSIRTKVIQILQRHLPVFSPYRWTSQRRPKGRYCSAWIHALHLQDILVCRETWTKLELFPFIQIRKHHNKFRGQRNRLVPDYELHPTQIGDHEFHILADLQLSSQNLFDKTQHARSGFTHELRAEKGVRKHTFTRSNRRKKSQQDFL